jgi:hypothetical protein
MPFFSDRTRDLMRNPRAQIALLGVAAFLSRLPFIDAGYGVNVDALASRARGPRDRADRPIFRFTFSWLSRAGNCLLDFLGAAAPGR